MDSKIEKSKNEQQNGTEEEGIPEEEIQLECFGARHTLAFLGLLGVMCIMTMRVNLSVAIVSMVNSTGQSNEQENSACPFPDGNYTEDSGYPNGEYEWDENTQGMLLGSLFYGYILTNILGGRAAEYFGGRLVVGLGIVLSAVFTLLSPLAARTSTTLFIIMRVLVGCCGGAIFPALNTMIARWYPQKERSKFASAIYAGTHLGTVIAMVSSGVLCASDFLGGWPSAFYVFGVLSAIWGVFWFWLIRDDPRDHPRISGAELKYILKGVPETTERLPLPWKSVLTSGPFWVIAIMHFGNGWGFYTLLTELPTYLDKILHIKIQNNGMLSSLPYLGAWVFSVVYSLMIDRLIARGTLSILSVRKLSMAIGGYGPMLGLIAMCFVNCNQVWALVVLFFSGSSNGSIYCGYMCSHADISPRYAGTLMGITNTFATIAGFVTPSITGALTEDNQTLWAWRTVFLISVFVYSITVTVYVLFVTTEVQPWNDPKPSCTKLKNDDKEFPNNEKSTKDINILKEL